MANALNTIILLNQTPASTPAIIASCFNPLQASLENPYSGFLYISGISLLPR
ncbi:hypothetical protein KJ707_00320 [Patescibacteria group bacterium]|nr:hypothetical protein [Patescibacteria group bacterium]